MSGMKHRLKTGCPICEKMDGRIVEFDTPEEMRFCAECEVTYAQNRATQSHFYEEAYAVGGDAKQMTFKNAIFDAQRMKKRGLFDSQLTYVQKRVLQNLLEFHRGSRILDIGSGPCWFPHACTKEDLNIVASDISLTCGNLAEELRIPFTHILEEFEKSSFPKEIEVITMFEVLEHLVDPKAFLIFLRSRYPRVTIYLSVPNPRSWTLLAGRHHSDYPPNHLTYWNKTSLQKLFAACGYENFEIFDDFLPQREDFGLVSLKWFASSWMRKVSFFKKSTSIDPKKDIGANDFHAFRFVSKQFFKYLVYCLIFPYLVLKGRRSISILAESSTNE